MKFNFVIICLILLSSCGFSDEELKKGWWKYGSGAHIEDVINFDSHTLSNDTIYSGKEAIGVIVDREESLFGMSSRKIFIHPIIESKVYLESGSDNSIGIYHQK